MNQLLDKYAEMITNRLQDGNPESWEEGRRMYRNAPESIQEKVKNYICLLEEHEAVRVFNNLLPIKNLGL